VPEGHALHRLAGQHAQLLVGRTVAAASPQGRFAAGAARLDGGTVTSVEAVGKHLFYATEELAERLHVHLGLYGTFTSGTVPPPEPRGALRLRLQTAEVWIDLRGPTACELLEPAAVTRILDRLGPDPLAPAADPDRAWQRLNRGRMPIAAALMDQAVIAGIGNVYRAELLFRHRRDPFRPARELPAEVWQAMWADVRSLMRAGVRSGRIVTTRPEHRDHAGRPVRREDAHYVYRRHGLPCRVCSTPVHMVELAGRRLNWCPACQVE
jgi:formamidopyrimidine-DNA glycosylase